jgi:hypothetical protein
MFLLLAVWLFVALVVWCALIVGARADQRWEELTHSDVQANSSKGADELAKRVAEVRRPW